MMAWNLRFFVNNLHLIPVFPRLYQQGKRIKDEVPELPEAEENTGIAGSTQGHVLQLLCIGESTIAGVGVTTHSEGFSGTLAKELSEIWGAQIRWDVQAKSGYTARKVHERLVPKIQERPDIIVVGLGGNDSFQLNSRGQWKKDINDLIDSLRSVNPLAEIYFTNLPPAHIFPAFTPLIKKVIGKRVYSLAKVLEKIVEPMPNVFFSSEPISIDTWSKRYQVKAEESQFFSDGVHPSKLTYQVWAKDMATFIVEHRKESE